MDDLELIFAAKRMIPLYGPDAEMAADEKTKLHSRSGRLLESMKWARIAAKIYEMQPKP